MHQRLFMAVLLQTRHHLDQSSTLIRQFHSNWIHQEYGDHNRQDYTMTGFSDITTDEIGPASFHPLIPNPQ